MANPAPVVAVVNMKGGVGKTTLSANLFREVFRVQRLSTLLVDFDPQYNLTQLLRTQAEYEVLREEGRTLWSAINPGRPRTVFDISEEDLVEPGHVDSFTVGLRRIGTSRLSLLPGDFRTAQLNLMTEQVGLRVRRERFRRLIANAASTYDLVVLDCNPSTSFMTRAAIESASHLLIPIRADKYSILGLKMLTEYVGGLASIVRPPEVLVVLNDIPRQGGQPAVVAEVRTDDTFGDMTLGNVVHSSGVLAARSDYSGFAVDRGVAYTETVRRGLVRVAHELAERLGIA